MKFSYSYCICFNDQWSIVFDETTLFEVIRNDAPKDGALSATLAGCSSSIYSSPLATLGHEPQLVTDLGQSITLKWPVNVQVKGSHASCFLPELEVIERKACRLHCAKLVEANHYHVINAERKSPLRRQKFCFMSLQIPCKQAGLSADS